jgi:hypothetical protein
MRHCLTEQQVRHWINSIFGTEGPEDGEHSLSPVARFVTAALADVPYVDAYTQLERIKGNERLRKFRSFLDDVVFILDDCGVRPWTAANEGDGN